MTPRVEAWALAFLWTLALEIPVMAAIMRGAFARWWVPVALAAGVNALSHPGLWFLFPRFGDYATWLVIAEAAVWTLEALLLTAALSCRLPWSRALGRGVLASVAANALTTAVGLLFFN